MQNTRPRYCLAGRGALLRAREGRRIQNRDFQPPTGILIYREEEKGRERERERKFVGTPWQIPIAEYQARNATYRAGPCTLIPSMALARTKRSRNYVHLPEELLLENGPLYRLQKHYLLFVSVICERFAK